MQFALLGADDTTLALATFAVEQAGADLVAACDVAGAEAQVRSLAPAVRIGADWETLLLQPGIDLVLVASAAADSNHTGGIAADERRAEQLRKLVQTETPTLAVHPACDLLLAYEMDMGRREPGRVALMHAGGLMHPAIAELQALIAQSSPTGVGSAPLGAIEHITLERALRQRDRGAVLKQFAADLPLLRSLIGPIRKLTASGPVTEAMVDPLGPKRKGLPSLSSLLVHLMGSAAFTARWSVIPAAEGESGKLTITAEHGIATLRMADGAPWRLETAIDGNRRETVYDADAEAAEAWQRLPERMLDADSPPTWTEACRDLEATAAIDRSIQRGRVVELTVEEQTEADAFKGVMAVGGCLTLLLVLLAVLVAATVEGLHLPLRTWGIWRLWPAFVLLPVVVFLASQLLHLVVKKGSRATPDRQSTKSAGEAAQDS